MTILPCVYKIIHVETNRCYVGHTSKKSHIRFNQHLRLLRTNKHHSKHLQNSWNKHKEESFLFEVIEYCTEETKIVREQHYIDSLNSEFNVERKAGTSRIGTTQPRNLVERQRVRMKGNSYTKGRIMPDDEKEHRAAMNRGSKRTLEQRATISEAMKGVPHPNAIGHIVTSETRRKIKEATDATRPTMNGKQHRQDSKEKASSSMKAFIEKNGHPSLGKKRSPETIERMRIAQRALAERKRSLKIP